MSEEESNRMDDATTAGEPAPAAADTSKTESAIPYVPSDSASAGEVSGTRPDAEDTPPAAGSTQATPDAADDAAIEEPLPSPDEPGDDADSAADDSEESEEFDDEYEDENDDTSCSLDSETVERVASIHAMLEDEGYGDDADGAMLLEFAGKLSSDAAELEKVLRETEVIRKRSQDFARRRGLSKAEMPWGNTNREVAGDAVPFHRRGCSSDLALLASQLDELAGLYEVDAPDPVQIHELGDAAKQTIAVLMNEHEDPRKVVYNIQRRNMWLKLQFERENPASDAFVRDLVRNQFKVLFTAHEPTLRQLREHYDLDTSAHMPDTSELLDDLSALEKSMGRPVDEYLEFLDGDEPKHYRLFTAGVRALLDERIISLSGGVPRVKKTARWEEIRQAIEQASNFGVVFEKQQALPDGLERIFILHWVVENVCKASSRKNAKIVDQLAAGAKKLGLPAAESPDRAPVGALVRAIERAMVLDLALLRKALTKRNNICHDGQVWKSNWFSGMVQDYQRGIGVISERCETSLYKIPVKPKKRAALDFNEMLKRVQAQFDEDGIDFERARTYLEPSLDEQIQEWANHNRPVASSLQRATFRYLEHQLGIASRSFIDTAVKAGVAKHLAYACRRDIFSKVAERRAHAQRTLQRVSDWKRQHGE